MWNIKYKKTLKVVLWKLGWASASEAGGSQRVFLKWEDIRQETRPSSLIGLIRGTPTPALLIKWSDGGDKGRLAGAAGPLSGQNEAKFTPRLNGDPVFYFVLCERRDVTISVIIWRRRRLHASSCCSHSETDTCCKCEQRQGQRQEHFCFTSFTFSPSQSTFIPLILSHSFVFMLLDLNIFPAPSAICTIQYLDLLFILYIYIFLYIYK